MRQATLDTLLKDLKDNGHLKTPLIERAFRAVKRELFVPEEHRAVVYENHPLPIGFGQTISQPLVVAFMLELLEPKIGEHVLEVGMGSGWKTALLAFCVGEKGSVVGVERIPELASFAEKNMAKISEIPHGAIRPLLGDGTQGSPADAPFDKIIAAASGSAIPSAWMEQLKVGGRIVAPVGNTLVVLDKITPTKFEEKKFYGFSFVPLVGA